MSDYTEENSWYKYLEKTFMKDSETASTKTLTLTGYCQPSFLIWLLRYVCTICMKSILELRMGQCSHEFCSACVPRFNCSVACQLPMLHNISSADEKSQEMIIEEFKASGTFIDMSLRNYKRKECTQDSDECKDNLKGASDSHKLLPKLNENPK